MKAPRGYVLAFHASHVAGEDYQSNDHVALNETLSGLATLRVPVLRLLTVVEALRRDDYSRLPRKFVCLTFDDGPDMDWREVIHPVHGPQESVFDILRRNSRRLIANLWLRKCVGTSFVIASPSARQDIVPADDPKRMSEDWWASAQRSGFLDIGSHGWNHVHPRVSGMKEQPGLIEAFDKISTSEQARLQVEDAAAYIRNRAGKDAAKLFAYPYGQVSEFMADQYLPAQSAVLGAFTTEGRPVCHDANLWRLPRYVCGWHWKSIEDLDRIILHDQ